MRGRSWLVALVALSALAVGAVALPGLARQGARLIIVVSLIVSIVVRLRSSPSIARPPWVLIALGASVALISAVVRAIHSSVAGVDYVYPSPADLLAYGAYILTLLGARSFWRHRTRRSDRDSVMDAAIVATAFAVVILSTILGDYLRDETVTLAHRVGNVVYSGMTIALIGQIARLAVGPGVRNTAWKLLAVGTLAFVANDLILLLASTGRDGAAEIAAILGPASIVFANAAILHPSVQSLTVAPEYEVPRLSGLRLTLLGVALLIVPGALLTSLALQSDPDLPVIVAGSAILTALTLARVRSLFRSRERVGDLEAALERSGRALLDATNAEEIARATAGGVRAVAGAGVRFRGLLVTEHERFEISGNHQSEAEIRPIAENDPAPSVEDAVSSLSGQFSVAVLGERGRFGYVAVDLDGDDAVRLALQTMAAQIAQALSSLELQEAQFARRSDQRLSALVEQSSDLVMVVDSDLQVVFVSSNSQRVFGMTQDQILGMNPMDLIHSDDSEVASEQLRHPTPADDVATPIEVRVKVGDSHRWFEQTTRDFRELDEVGGVVLTSRDVTERRAAAQRLQESEARFKALVQNSSDLVAVTDKALNSTELFDPVSGRWSTAGRLADDRSDHTATLLADGTVLVAGGFGAGSRPLSSVEFYDPVSGRWSAAGKLTSPGQWTAVAKAPRGCEKTATLLADGKVLVTGGIVYTSVCTELYDPVSAQWTSTSSRRQDRWSGQRATLLGDGTVLLVGGLANLSDRTLSAPELYDPDREEWSPLGGHVALLPTVTLLADGKVLVTGGLIDGKFDVLSSKASVYDPVSRRWNSAGQLARARYSHTATLLGDETVLVAGGIGPDHGRLGSVELYDPSIGDTGQWTALPSLKQVQGSHTATLLLDGRVLVVSGRGKAELYDPVRRRWSPAGSFEPGQVGSTATLLADGKVLVTGTSGNAELYHPVSGQWSAVAGLERAPGSRTATLLGDGKVLVVAGTGSSSVGDFAGRTAIAGTTFVLDGKPGTVKAVAMQPDGKTIVGGEFSSVGESPRRNLARLKRDGTLDEDWLPDPNGTVEAIFVRGGDIFVGGAFDHIGGIDRPGIAKLHATLSGAADQNWDAGLGEGAVVYAIGGSIRNDDLFVGGRSFRIEGAPTASNLAKLAGETGRVDETWKTTSDGPVRAIALRENEEKGNGVYLGGDFSSVNGDPMSRLAKVDSISGQLDTDWKPQADSTVGAIALAGDSVFVGGSFLSINGTERNGLAKLGLPGDELVDAQWNAHLDAGAEVHSLALTGDEQEIIAAGRFSATHGRNGVARFETAGAGDPTTWIARLQGEARAVLIDGDTDDVYLGGTFAAASGTATFLARVPAIGAPRVGVTSANEGADLVVEIGRNAADGGEVSHFWIAGIEGGTLLRADGVPARERDFITVEQGLAGLVFQPDANEETVSRIEVVSAIGPDTTHAESAATIENLEQAATRPAFGNPQIRFAEGGGIIFSFGSEPGATYQLQRSTDLMDWTELERIEANGDTVQYLDEEVLPVERPTGETYYRAREVRGE